MILKCHSALEYHQMKVEWNLMWDIASSLPYQIGATTGEKIVQIIDEFQNIDKYIYDLNTNLINNLSNTYTIAAEKKEAPLIVTGSETNRILKIINNMSGRFQTYHLEELAREQAIECIENYASYRKAKLNKTAKDKILTLTGGNPFYIKTLFLSRYNTNRDYTDYENIVEVYSKEIDINGELYNVWMESMDKAFDNVNGKSLKRILLYLFNAHTSKNRIEIKKDLKLKESDEELERKLDVLISNDLIIYGNSTHEYSIPSDKTYEFVFRQRYQADIEQFEPDITQEIRKTIGMFDKKRKSREFFLQKQFKQPFNLKDITYNGPDLKITPYKIREKDHKQNGLSYFEIDFIIYGLDNYELLIDVKDTKAKYGKRECERWLEIAESQKKENRFFLVYSKNGFTTGTIEALSKAGILVINRTI